MRDLRAERRDRGLCTDCGSEPLPGSRRCARHKLLKRRANARHRATPKGRRSNREHSARRRDRRLAMGLCAQCGAEAETLHCERCLKAMRVRTSDRKVAMKVEQQYGERIDGVLGRLASGAGALPQRRRPWRP